MKSAIITGVTGQDGSYLAELLLSKGYEVHGMIRRHSTPCTQRIDHIVDANFHLHYGDTTDSMSITNLIRDVQPDEFYNLAAQSHVDTLNELYNFRNDISCSVKWLREDESGNISMANRKFVFEADAAFDGLQDNLNRKFDKATLFKILANNDGSTPLAAKVFKRQFLADNGIRFDDGDDAIQMFAANAMLKADEIIFTPNPFYIAPRK